MTNAMISDTYHTSCLPNNKNAVEFSDSPVSPPSFALPNVASPRDDPISPPPVS